MSSSISALKQDSNILDVSEHTRLELTLNFRDQHALSRFKNQTTECETCQHLPKLPDGEHYGCQTCCIIRSNQEQLGYVLSQSTEAAAAHSKTASENPTEQCLLSQVPGAATPIRPHPDRQTNAAPMSPDTEFSKDSQLPKSCDVFDHLEFDSSLNTVNPQPLFSAEPVSLSNPTPATQASVSCLFPPCDSTPSTSLHLEGNFQHENLTQHQVLPQAYNGRLPLVHHHDIQQIRESQDYQMQLMLLEQQNKKRLMLAEEQKAQQPHYLENYQKQLMLLEQQNKKRGGLRAQHQDQKGDELRNHQMQLMHLEQQNKKRLMIAHQGKSNIICSESVTRDPIKRNTNTVVCLDSGSAGPRNNAVQQQEAEMRAQESQSRIRHVMVLLQHLSLPANLRDAVSRDPTLQDFLLQLDKEKSSEMGEMVRKVWSNVPISVVGPLRSYSDGSNPGQDYQMQLILLEHQKRMKSLREMMDNERRQLHPGYEGSPGSPEYSHESGQEIDGDDEMLNESDSEMLDETQQKEFENSQFSFQAKPQAPLPPEYVRQLTTLEDENKRRLVAEQQHKQYVVWHENQLKLSQDIQRQARGDKDASDVNGAHQMTEAFREYYSQMQR